MVPHVRRAFSTFGLTACGLSICGLLGLGCADAMRPFSQDHVNMHDYKPLSVPSATPVHERWSQLQRLAATESWHLESFDETRGLMIADRTTGGTTDIREHVRVVLKPDRSEIAVQTEVLEDGEWDSRDLTCGKYEYSRETEIAIKLEAQ
jgi:hypothetical protein